MSEDWKIRPATQDDLEDIADAWLQSYRKTYRPFKRAGKPGSVAWNAWTKEHRPVVVHLLQRAEVTVVCDPTRPHLLFGFLCAEPGIVHYMAIKTPYIESGFAHEMAADLLGTRPEKPHIMSHEIHGFQPNRRKGEEPPFGPTPPNWHIDEHWLAKRFLEGT